MQQQSYSYQEKNDISATNEARTQRPLMTRSSLLKVYSGIKNLGLISRLRLMNVC
jgi:hypothetical protein